MRLLLGVIGLLLTPLVYIRIYFAARRHKNHIQALQVLRGAENCDMANFPILIKSVVGVFYVYLVILVCCLSFFISVVAFAISGSSISIKRFFLFSWTLLFLNSSLNPVIYCWTMRHIQRAVMDILQKTPWNSFDICSLITLFLGVIGLLLTSGVYIRICFAARRHTIQIQALQVQGGAENGDMANFASLIKSAVSVFYVYLVYLVCYSPAVTYLTAFAISGPSISIKRLFLLSWTLSFLNSSLNPVIYCWKMRHIRRAVMETLQNTPWFRNRRTR